MSDFVILMWKPLLACLILTGIHAYLGIHVVERKVIFVDLALAQIAALGAVLGLLLGWELHEFGSYACSLVATFAGATVFALTRMRREKIPQEALIGIVYAVSAAAAILILSRTAEGDEHIRHMLVGNILLVDTRTILKMAVLYAAIGAVHFRFRNKFMLISTRPEEAFSKGISVRMWDFFFYAMFGFVVTSSVEVAGVLLVFSYLIIPSVAAMMYAERFRTRIVFGWLFGAAVSAVGVTLSYFLDFPTGATIVCAFGLFLAFAGVLRRIC